MKQEVKIKNWFLEKEGYYYVGIERIQQSQTIIKKETAKAVLVTITWWDEKEHTINLWVPKSCTCEEWEKQTSNFAYHGYLVNVYHKAYDEGLIEHRTIKSGRNCYRRDAFVHQLKTKDLIEALNSWGVPFMNKQEWINR